MTHCTSTIVRAALAFTAIAAFATCTDAETGGYSETLSLRLSGIQPQDIDNDGGYQEEKNVATENGNPYAAFLRNAEDRLGTSPAAIAIRSASVRLDEDSSGVTALGDAFASVELFLGDSETRVGMGSATNLGGSESGIAIPSDQSSLAPIQSELLGNSFNVGVRGDAADSRPADFDVRLIIDIQFEAIP